MAILSPETQAKVALWRQKARDGTLTMEESREALKLLREDRLNAGATTTKASAGRSLKAQAAAVDTKSLLLKFKSA